MNSNFKLLYVQVGKKSFTSFLHSLYFAKRFNRPVDINGQTNFDCFFYPRPKFWGYRGEIGGVFDSNGPLVLLVNPCKSKENANR